MSEEKKFKKAELNMPYLRIALYGNTGSGKTFTGQELAKGLAALSGQRVACIDTDPMAPSSLYAKKFDFDIFSPANLDEFEEAIEKFDVHTYGVLLVDTITWYWRGLTDANDIKKTSTDNVRFGEWAKIKRMYRDTLIRMLNLPCHLIITGREQIEYDITSNVDEVKPIGFKMNAEKETPYELNLNIRLFVSREGSKPDKTGRDTKQLNLAEVIRDRTGILTGRVFQNMTFKDIEPLTKLLCGQLQPMPMATEDAIANQAIFHKDQEKLEKAKQKSESIKMELLGKLHAATSLDELAKIHTEMVSKKRSINEDDQEVLRATYKALIDKFSQTSDIKY